MTPVSSFVAIGCLEGEQSGGLLQLVITPVQLFDLPLVASPFII